MSILANKRFLIKGFIWYILDMLFTVVAFGISVLLDFIIYKYFETEIRRIFSTILVLFLVLISLVFLFFDFNIFALLFSYFSIFRIINYVKIIDFNKQVLYLKNSFFKVFKTLAVIQALILLFNYLFDRFIASFKFQIILISLIQFLFVGLIAYSTARSYKKLFPKKPSKFLNDKDLPSVSVAIPARNENKDLEECLISLLSSDYPKLEIVVLDDCSQSKKVAEIIRSFAHDGVIFVEGKTPPRDYLAKNYAYEQLSEVCNGQIIVFAGVDLRFDPSSIRNIVEFMINKKKRAISLIPTNNYDVHNKFRAMLAQPLRYLWEVALPRRFLNKPAVLSTLWAVYKEDLLDFGDFKGLKRNIIPERTIVQKIALSKDGYSFMLSDDVFKISSLKSYEDQKNTAFRLKYPSLKQRLDYLSFVLIIEFLIFVLPVFELIIALLSKHYLLSIYTLAVLLSFNVVYYFVLKISYAKSIKISLLGGFLAGIYDIYLWFESMRQYEFGEVLWKGRNVCIPVMRTVEDQN